MPSNAADIKQNADCQVHGAPARSANKMLLIMVTASLALIIWHVWVYGPTGQIARPEASWPFIALLGSEFWDLLFNSRGILAELWDVFPYFIIGILLAGYIRTYKIAVKLQSKFRRHGLLSVVLASFVGMITPLCACGTLTTAVSLLFAGMPLAPVMALLVTSPLLSPTTYLLTLNDLGPEWTVIRTIAAFSMGMFAGVVALLLRDRGFQTKEIFIEGAIPRGDFHDESYPDERLRCNCKETFGHRVAAKTGNMFVVFLAKSSEMLWTVGKYILVGVAIGAVIERYMPSGWITGLFGKKGPLSILWVTLGSVPIFLHQISASSILYHIKSSLSGTLDGGAGLAFMIGGPVTAMPTMVMFWTIFKKRVFALYLFVCIIGTLLIAYAFQFLVFVPYVDIGNPLIRNVGSLSGSRTAMLVKTDKNVRMVMDPAGKGLIATYANDLDGSGGIVFDAGDDRFVAGRMGILDNGTYAGNVARWLSPGSTTGSAGRILLYDLSPDPDAGTLFPRGDLRARLDKLGFIATIAVRKDIPRLSDEDLAGYEQIWIFTGAAGRQLFSPAEQDALERFHASGKGLLIAAGPSSSYNDGLAAADQLSKRYGVRFSGSVDRPEALPVSRASLFFNGASDFLKRVLHLVHKA